MEDETKQRDRRQQDRQRRRDEAGIYNAVLTPRASDGFGIGDARERDHGAFANIRSKPRTLNVQRLRVATIERC